MCTAPKSQFHVCVEMSCSDQASKLWVSTDDLGQLHFLDDAFHGKSIASMAQQKYHWRKVLPVRIAAYL